MTSCHPTSVLTGPSSRGASSSARTRNLDELKEFVRHAKPGSGQVLKAISEAQSLGIRGFTTLLQSVAHERTSSAWQKALEIKSAMDARTDLRGNVYTYTVSRAGQSSGT